MLWSFRIFLLFYRQNKLQKMNYYDNVVASTNNIRSDGTRRMRITPTKRKSPLAVPLLAAGAVLALFHFHSNAKLLDTIISNINNHEKKPQTLWRNATKPPILSEANTISVNHDTTSTSILLQQQQQQQQPAAEFPYLVMYVGPGKTATTTVQDALTQLEHQGILEQDNYVFLGKRAPNTSDTFVVERWSPMLQAMIPPDRSATACQSSNVTECWYQYALPELQDLAQQRKHILIHEEYLGMMNFDDSAFHEATKDHFRVVIVVGYRRKWSWDASIKNQREKFQSKKWPDPLIVNHSATSSVPRTIRGRPTPSPPLFKHFASENGFAFHEVIRRYNTSTWRKDPPPSFRIFNMHEANPLAHFLCDIVPDAKHSCAAAETLIVGSDNPSVNLDYHLIAVEAADRGLLKRAVRRGNRRKTVEQLEKCAEGGAAGSLIPLPMDCLDDESSLQLYLNKSITMERDMVAKYSDRGSSHLKAFVTADEEERHRESFWNSTSKFCSANITAIMEDPRWLDCFAKANEES